jgi:hypothetical protein
MKKPVNFETITFQKYKFLGINWEIRVEGVANIGNGDFTRVWLLPDNEGERQLNRVFYFDIFWDKNKCEVYVPVVGDGVNGPHIKNFGIMNENMKTPDEFKSFLEWMVEDIINEFNVQNASGISNGPSVLSFLVKSDSSDVYHDVKYVNKNWSCSCKSFVYSKQLPQTCKHIDKLKK